MHGQRLTTPLGNYHLVASHAGKKFLGRSAIREVADKRLPLLNDFLQVRVPCVIMVRPGWPFEV